MHPMSKCPGGGFGAPGGGFGGPGGGFRTGRSSGKATAGTGAKKTTPGPPKPPPGQFSSWSKKYTSYFWTGTLIKSRDYSDFLQVLKNFLMLSNDFLILCFRMPS